MELIICNDAIEAAKKATEVFIEQIKEKSDSLLGFATGSTPLLLYKNLAEANKNGEVSFENVKTVNLDEYVGLEPTHDQSYRYFMNTNLFDNLNIKKENTYVPNGIGDPYENAKKYDEVLEKLGAVDLQLLGIGNNGHIAFNEPGSSFEATTSIIDLTENTIQANSRFFESIDNVPKKAISMGIKSILSAKKIVLIATGKNKAEALRDMFKLEPTEAMPASALQNHPNVLVFADKDAASLM